MSLLIKKYPVAIFFAIKGYIFKFLQTFTNIGINSGSRIRGNLGFRGSPEEDHRRIRSSDAAAASGTSASLISASSLLQLSPWAHSSDRMTPEANCSLNPKHSTGSALPHNIYHSLLFFVSSC